MQLLKAKLAGFKSFVDPTTIDTPSKLVAIVGPNGCGKSNVIDAITWVMGESSPKYLRGESSTDVIFNGSNARKPVGQASVELVFDNSDGTIGGEYAKFAEISIKRMINRDSDSTYYLNGTRCRKRDVVDIFLHTGLGARSYTIIGQNTIMEMAEAKPDHLRNHLERAAGISKYKERRHETELRMQRTQENLARVNDLCTELEKQLGKLKHQANVAEKYKVLKEEERLLRGQLYGVQWRTLDGQMIGHTLQIQREETALEGKHSDISAIDTAMEKIRDDQRLTNEAFQEAQKKYYTVGSEINRLEQAITHHQEREQQWQDELSQTNQQWQSISTELANIAKNISECEASLAMIEPEYQAADVTAKNMAGELTQAEDAMQTWQGRWDEFNQQVAKTGQLAQVEKNHSEYLEQKINTLIKRLAQLEQDSGRFNFEALQIEKDKLAAETTHIEATLATQQAELTDVKQTISANQAAQLTETNQLDKVRSELQKLRGQQASLEALQQTALGQRDQRISPWINKHQLNQKTRLAQSIRVDAGWELAVEKVLGNTLQAICIDQLNDIAPFVSEFDQGNLSIYTKTPVNLATSAHHGTTLLQKVKCDMPLESLLGHIYIADSLSDALTLCEKIAAHESVVTQDGIWLNRSWLKVLREKDPAAGIFQREEELKQLTLRIAELETNQAALEQNIKTKREEVQTQEALRERLQQSLNQTQMQLSQVKAQFKMKQERLLEIQKQAERLQAEQKECAESLTSAELELKAARDIWEKALADLEQLNMQREDLTQEREKARETVQRLREAARKQTESTHRLAMQRQNNQSQLSALQQNKDRGATQLTGLEDRKAALQNELDAMPLLDDLQQSLQTTLDQHNVMETELNAAREVMEAFDHEFRSLEQNRQAIERDINQMRTGLERLRLDCQGWKVKADTIKEQMAETTLTLEEVLLNLPAEITAEDWQIKLDQIVQRINRLGPINLVAIDEYATCLERKEYLDKQLEDLQAGLKMLEDAIAKIDKETRSRFKETFDKVNERFQELFPHIFGGGKAYLELTTDNLLDAGVTMMACPPGKRNSSVQLLSGGEKSLTAIALIFSIFHLNPAPFCLLDEVDAALDDANVLRFTRIVKSMADKTQFVFISHNKITIEMANHLIGVTMHEPGVSRLVSVDIEKAISMVEAE